MCKVLKVLVGLGIGLVLVNGVEGATKGSTGAQVLKLGVGVRPIALGEAFCGLADDLNAIYYNPAGLAQLTEKQFMAMHTDWLDGIGYEFIGYSQPLDRDKALGLSLIYLGSGDIEKMDANGIKEGNFNAKDMVFNLSYSSQVSEALSFGAGIKAISLKIDNEKASSVAIDVGFLSRTPIENLSIGGVLQNIGTRVKFINEGDKLPLNIKLGSAYKSMDDKLIFLLDINKLVDNKIRLNSGIESQIIPALTVRCGYNSGVDEGAGLTFGLGFKYRICQLDYAYVPYGDLGETHRYCILIKLW